MTRSNVSAALVLLALFILCGIGGAADARPLNGMDAVLALTAMVCLGLGARLERGSS